MIVVKSDMKCKILNKNNKINKFCLHFLQLGKVLKNSSCLQSGEIVVIQAARQKSQESLAIQMNKSVQMNSSL